MHIVIPDDNQHAVRGLACFAKLSSHQVTIYHDTTDDIDVLAQRFREADALVLTRERTAITAALLDRLPKLKLIAQTGRGTAHVDVDACTQRGVAVAVGTGWSVSPAELTWALIMASVRRLPSQIETLKAGQWATQLGNTLHGRTLGLFGYGGIGKLIAGYGRAFGMHVMVWGRESTLDNARADGFETAASQRDLFERADIVSLHLKLVKETRGIVTAEDLAAMKPTALLVNTSRAGLIAGGDSTLVAALKAGRPGFAAVDVYDHEPVIDHPLLHMENALCTPHLGYVDEQSYEMYFGAAFDNVNAFAAGTPTGVINPAALTRS